MRERIEKIKQLIVLYENAEVYLISNPTKSYTLDTGQSEQKVTYQDLSSIRKTVETLMNQLSVYEKRCSSVKDIYMPAF